MLYNVSKYIIQIVRYDMLFFKRLGKRGAALTEYAILLAFVAAIGASFTASNGLEDSIRGAIGKAEKVLAADTNNPGDSGAGSGGSGAEEGESGDNTGSGSGDNGGSVIPPDPTTPPDTEEPADPVKPPDSNKTPNGNFGFYDPNDNAKYGSLFDDLVDYLLTDREGYKKEDLVSAEVNNKTITLEYNDGTKKQIGLDGRFDNMAFEIQAAELYFANGELINKADSISSIHIKKDGGGNEGKFTLDKNDNMFHRQNK